MFQYLEFAKSLALEAGTIMQSEREGRLRVRQKPDRSLVTHVDIAINELVIDAIREHFPGHSIIGEELSFGPANAEHIWRVDPLDGTGEYIEGESTAGLTYGFGIAKQCTDGLEMGLFFNPSKDELYTAIRGLGAHMNGRQVGVGRQAFQANVAYDYCHWEGATPDARLLRPLLGKPLGHYSAIYQGCMVATGESAFSVFPGNTYHDIAPAAILVTEAGGSVTDTLGIRHDFITEPRGAVFSNGRVHRQVLEVLDVFTREAREAA